MFLSTVLPNHQWLAVLVLVIAAAGTGGDPVFLAEGANEVAFIGETALQCNLEQCFVGGQQLQACSL